jgi:SAM-dependent methyltransferase
MDGDDRRRVDYRSTNLANWESRVPVHASSTQYGLDRYRDDPEHLSGVVRFDLPRLGDIAGLDVVHLQCHIGTDTVSLGRLGARVTGLDFSPSAIAVARDLASAAGVDAVFVDADVYDAVEVLGARNFDLVYTGIGALCWLPDIRRWAGVVAGLLRDGGRLFIREGHPVVWALDDPRDDREVVLAHPYFETDGVVFVEDQTYVEQDEPLAAPTIVHFNHGLGEIMTALMDEGMQIVAFEEHDSLPWSALGEQMEMLPGGEYRLIDRPERLPHSYTLQAVRR